jgi:hypothetical protein
VAPRSTSRSFGASGGRRFRSGSSRSSRRSSSWASCPRTCSAGTTGRPRSPDSHSRHEPRRGLCGPGRDGPEPRARWQAADVGHARHGYRDGCGADDPLHQADDLDRSVRDRVCRPHRGPAQGGHERLGRARRRLRLPGAVLLPLSAIVPTAIAQRFFAPQVDGEVRPEGDRVRRRACRSSRRRRFGRGACVWPTV